MSKNKGGRPKVIEGETVRVTFNLRAAQAEFISEKSLELSVSESEMIRIVIDSLMKKSS